MTAREPLVGLGENPTVGFTGTREGMTTPQRVTLECLLLERGPRGILHHGGAIGADAQALATARRLGWVGRPHPPKAKTSKELLARNRRIVGATPELIATPKGFTEEWRSGTWATVRYAREAARPVTIIWPDGTIHHETAGSR